MADPHTATDDHDAYVRGSQEIGEQTATFALFKGLAKWGSLLVASVIAFLTVWFMPDGGFIAGLFVFVVMMVAGWWFMRTPKTGH